MRLLLDSCVVVWWMDDPKRVAPAARAAITDSRNAVFLSAASVWELGLKIARGKLRLPADYVARLRQDGITDLSVTVDHAVASLSLPNIHADPFDRLLIAQAVEEGLVLVTRDHLILQYPVAQLAA